MTKVLCAVVQLQDATLTDVSFNLIAWASYFANHPTLRVDIKRFNTYPFERNFNDIVRYGIDNDYDYIFQYDADMVGNRTIIEKLISYDKECVGCLFFSRYVPHKTQAWMIKTDLNGEIDHATEYEPYFWKQAILNRELIKTDVRAGGFTLFKVSALKSLTYPYAEFKPNKRKPFHVHGIDLDITWKLTKKFGGVWTDCDRALEVKHLAFQGIGYASQGI